MDQNKPEERTDKQNGDRSLPRGLEHVSNIFLSGRNWAGSAQDNSQAASTEQSGTRPGDASVSVVLRPCAFSGRESLTAVIRKQAGSIEEGMKAIDTNIPCEGSGSIDLLALDGKNQLVIIDLEDRPTRRVVVARHRPCGVDGSESSQRPAHVSRSDRKLCASTSNISDGPRVLLPL